MYSDSDSIIRILLALDLNNDGNMTAYEAPEWALNGSNRFGLSMEVIKGGIILEKVELVTSSKSYFVAGRMEPLCDIVLQHPSVSRTHAALQFDAKGQLFLVDLGSTHGTFVNKKRISAADHIELHVGDVVVFGESTRIYTILGPVDLMPDEYSYFPSRSSQHILTLPRKDDTSGPYVSSVTKDTVNLTKDSKLYTRLQNRIQKLENLKLESSRIRAKQNVGLTDGQEAALGLRADLKLLDAQTATSSLSSATTSDLTAEEADSLDMYMLTSAQSLAAQDAAKATANRSRLVERIQETEKLLEIATPAWAKLVVAPPAVADDIPVPVDMTAYVSEG
ncbi:hypothetical protein B5M09_002263 [Aphanomyces astaci]|uniref:FHA domain-containing protein n=1 Tax=Aphanomyces astaci TaxID=112090 RepID=A0A3R7YDI0_APHAT|nr:hypothetical protein B5M09_002263 [Aphanomyces astaci]